MTREEAINLLKGDITRFNELRQNDQERLDLRGVNLSRANLQKADLRRIDFTGANFEKARLSEAQFGGSILDGAQFCGADLLETNFHHARMQGADLRGAKYTCDTRMGRLCFNLSSFERVHWEKEFLEEVLGILNQNMDWHIKYEIIPRTVPAER